jgi:hypothetical protein
VTQHTIQLPEELYEAVRKRAAAQQKTPDTLVAELLSAQIETTETSEKAAAFEREIAAFERLKPALLEQYAGQYVAIYQGQVVAVGDNRLELVKQVYSRFGQVVCYVEEVTSDAPRQVRIPSFWKVR